MIKTEGLVLDLNRNRIQIILSEAYDVCRDYLNSEFYISKEDFLASADPYINSHRVSIEVKLPLPCKAYPLFCIDLNLRGPKVFARLPHPKKQADINRYLKNL